MRGKKRERERKGICSVSDESNLGTRNVGVILYAQGTETGWDGWFGVYAGGRSKQEECQRKGRLLLMIR